MSTRKILIDVTVTIREAGTYGSPPFYQSLDYGADTALDDIGRQTIATVVHGLGTTPVLALLADMGRQREREVIADAAAS